MAVRRSPEDASTETAMLFGELYRQRRQVGVSRRNDQVIDLWGVFSVDLRR
ncbi:hypothetical protein [Actinomadura rugatobispora]|uniref:hypothetical protein n=1 Tax=Actinomadura rugatobispora TaxID=1994 RepID=UPI0036733293